MKRWWGVAIGLFAPLLASAANIAIPPQALGASLQELAQQSGIQIIFFSKVVEGRNAPALHGTFTPEAALTALLDGTDLTYHVLNDRTIEVAARPVAAASEAAPDAPIEEVEITAERAKLSAMRTEIEKLEREFYREYNKRNTRSEYAVACSSVMPTGTHVVTEICLPAFATDAQVDMLSRGSRLRIQAMTPEYQKHMVTVVRSYPYLFELVKEHNALIKRYEAERKKKFEGGQIFVWE